MSKKLVSKKSKTLKKMNCNPVVRGKTINKRSCFTRKTLSQMKDAYNRNNSKHQIRSKTTKNIHLELSEKISECNEESCWLNQIPERERNQLREKMFSPKKPYQWKSNPREWLSNIDILNVLRQYEDKHNNFKFIGPTPINYDTIPKNDGICVWQELCDFQLQNYIDLGKKKIGIIFNLDRHDQSGSHWVSIFIDIDEKIIYYFDSAANAIPQEIKKFIDLVSLQSKGTIQFFTNIPHQHQEGDTECGMYSLFFIITMLEKKISMKKKINFFTKKHIKDNFVYSFRDKYFN